MKWRRRSCFLFALLLIPVMLSAHILQYFRWLDVARTIQITPAEVRITYDCRFLKEALAKPDRILDVNGDSIVDSVEKEQFLTQARDYVTSDLYVLNEKQPIESHLVDFSIAADNSAFHAVYSAFLPKPISSISTETLVIIDPVFLLGQTDTGLPPKPTVVSADSGVVLESGLERVSSLTIPSVVSSQIVYARASDRVLTDKTNILDSGVQPSQGQRLKGLLSSGSASPWIVVVSLLVAALLGAAHGLTPGHGKTIVAAYLVGSHGRIRDAVTLALIVTFTHTFSVILIGVFALTASHFIQQRALFDVLSLASGALVTLFGGYLFLSRLRDSGFHAHGLHFHSHGEVSGIPDHHHGPGGHTHPALERLNWKGLAALGVSGGIVPCPDAIVVLLLAVGMNRIPLGLAIIAAFSVGLAAVLTGIGILMVTARPLLEKYLGGDRSRFAAFYLPIGSAAIVMALGVGIVFKTLMDMGVVSVNLR